MNNNEDLGRYQDHFIAAAFDGAPASDLLADIAMQPGFAVYRNTLLKGCVDNLAANFPTVLRLVGEQWFRATALEYASQHAPTGASLFDYGTTFPAFLAGFPPAAGLPYLAAVAQLDRMWIDCHTAADAPALPASALASLPPEALGAARLPPHPATRWLRSDGHPAGAIWIANREQAEFADGDGWQGDCTLLTRIDNAVHWRLIDTGTTALLDACMQGAELQQAAAHALSVQPGLDIAVTLALLLQAGAFTTFT